MKDLNQHLPWEPGLFSPFLQCILRGMTSDILEMTCPCHGVFSAQKIPDEYQSQQDTYGAFYEIKWRKKDPSTKVIFAANFREYFSNESLL